MAWDAFMTLEGVSGESQREGHEGEIEVISFSFGASNPSSIGVGGGGGTGTVSLSQSFQCHSEYVAVTFDIAFDRIPISHKNSQSSLAVAITGMR